MSKKIFIQFFKLQNQKKISYQNIFNKILELIELLLAMSGYNIRNADFFRTVIMLFSITFSIYYIPNYQSLNFKLASFYFLLFEVAYMWTVCSILSKNGYSTIMISKYGEDKAYRTYVTILGFLFFHNAFSLGYVASSTPKTLGFYSPYLIYFIAPLFATGTIIKIWSAYVVKIDVYYWKDMFLNRKICEFVESGPYKILSNPMYGVGQLQGYAIALYYESLWGLLAAFINQFMVFAFYYFVEKKFIYRTYILNK